MFNPRVQLFGCGKLRSKWEGPFLIINTETPRAVMLQDDDNNILKVNGLHLKVFHEHSISEQEIYMVELIINPDLSSTKTYMSQLFDHVRILFLVLGCT